MGFVAPVRYRYLLLDLIFFCGSTVVVLVFRGIVFVVVRSWLCLFFAESTLLVVGIFGVLLGSVHHLRMLSLVLLVFCRSLHSFGVL